MAGNGTSSFEWDPKKRDSNLKEHLIDFRIVAIAMSESEFPCYRSDQKGEVRYVGRLKIKDQTIAAIFTRRGETIRIISARKWKAKDDKRLGALHP